MKIACVTSITCLLLVLFTASCTIEKRVHLKGYHTQWNGKSKAATKPTLVKKQEIKNEYQIAQISDSVGTLIKAAVAEKSKTNQDSVLALIAKWMCSSPEVNTLEAEVNHKSNSKTVSQNQVSSLLSRQVELIKNFYALEKSSQLVDSTEKSPDYIEPVEQKRSNSSHRSSNYSRGARLGGWSLALLIISLIVPILGLLAFIALPFVAVTGIVQSNKEMDAPGTDIQTEIIRDKARRGKTLSIVSLAIWGFFVLLFVVLLLLFLSFSLNLGAG